MKKCVNVRILAETQMFRRIRYITVNVFQAAESISGADRELNILQLSESAVRPADIMIIDTDLSEVIPDALVIKVLKYGSKAIWIPIYANISEIPRFMPLGLYAVVFKKRLEAELIEILKRLF